MNLDTLKALLASATPGPWDYILEHPRTSLGGVSTRAVPKVRAKERTILEGYLGDDPANADAVANLHNAAPALIACAEAAQFVVENLPGALSNHIGCESYLYADMARDKAARELAGLRAALKALEDA